MKLVKQISTGKILYRQSPDFEEGKGLLNAITLYPEINISDITEIDYIGTEQTYQDMIKMQTPYTELRKRDYPPIFDYIDAKVKQGSMDTAVQLEGVAQEQKYIQDCLAIKAKYPKRV